MARPPSTLYRLRKSVRRNRLAYSAVGAVVMALAAGIAFSSWQAVRALRAEKLAEVVVPLSRKVLGVEHPATVDAMARTQLGRTNEARADFAELEKLRPAFPAPPTPSAILLQPDAMAVGLAYEEARALLTEPRVAKP